MRHGASDGDEVKGMQRRETTAVLAHRRTPSGNMDIVSSDATLRERCWCYTPSMDRVEQMEAAISGLAPEEYQRFVQWFRAREQARWDEQLDRDSTAGKLDFLFEEADRESAQGLLREWPPKE